MPGVLMSDDTRLHYSETGRRGAPAVLSLHGLGSDSRADGPLADAVGERLHLVRLDLRGHGKSEPLTDPDRYDLGRSAFFERAATDAVEVLDALGWERATIVGGSLGAAVTTATVLASPRRVAAVGLFAPALGAGPGFGNPMVVAFLQGVQEHGLVGLLELLVAGMPDLLPGDTLAEVRDDYGRQDDAAMRACCTALERAVLVDDLGRLSAIEAPAFVVGHDGDALHPWTMAEAYARRVPGARLVRVDATASASSRARRRADLLVELASINGR